MFQTKRQFDIIFLLGLLFRRLDDEANEEEAVIAAAAAPKALNPDVSISSDDSCELSVL